MRNIAPYAGAVITFVGKPGATYTGIGSHIAICNITDLPQGGGIVFYDDPYNFEYCSLDEETYLNDYDWFGPGPDTQSRTRPIKVGNTTAPGKIDSVPDHVAVVVDNAGYPTKQTCPTGNPVYLRKMEMQVVDAKNNPINYNASVQEAWTNYSAPNACPNTGKGSPSPCAATGDAPGGSTGQFSDSMAAFGQSGNPASLCNPPFNPSTGCGFSLTSTWSACSNGSTESLWASPRITLSNGITVNSNSTHFAVGTQLH